MFRVLICATDAVQRELASSPLGRDGFERQLTSAPEQALAALGTGRLALVVVDRDVAGAEALIAQIRNNTATRTISILVVARGDMQSEELGLIAAGANAVLRLPHTPDWDARIARLIKVPARKTTRVPVLMGFEARFGVETVTGHLLNISQTGMLVETSSNMAVGDDLEFSFQLHGFESSTGEVRGQGRVVRLAGKGRYGIEYVSVDDSGREKLRRFLLVP